MSAYDLLELTFGPVMPLLSKALRAQLVAPKGKVFYGGDFSNIEGRLNAWFAGEDWKLEAFREYDAGRGPDLYKLAFSRAFGLPVEEVKKPQRQVGKTQELSGGYQGSIGAWLRFDPYPDQVARITKERFEGTDTWRKAALQYDHARFHFDLTADQWIAIKVNVNNWREANSAITKSWWEVQDAAIFAVESPGVKVTALSDKIAYMVDDGFLWCLLPSGKLLAYANPRLVEMKEEWLVDADGEVVSREELDEAEVQARIAAGAKIETGRTRTQVAFDGKNQKTGQWGRIYLYGGMQCNHYTQATARELLRFALHNIEHTPSMSEEARAITQRYHGTEADWMRQLRATDWEKFGYPLVLHCHDETVSEVDEGFGSVEEYQALMSILPPWLPGLPLAAKAWTHTRYVK